MTGIRRDELFAQHSSVATNVQYKELRGEYEASKTVFPYFCVRLSGREQGSTQRECYWLLLEKNKRKNLVVKKRKEKSEKCIFKKQRFGSNAARGTANHSHVKQDAVKKAPAHWKMNFVLPHMYSNVYTSAQTETHLVCQTSRKTFLLTGRCRDALRK